mmetsp:Transcript_98980/g.154715  ORF Transcript_98980/g.154715 Transcript_98980/m.154715 type:complete len:86 (-) Transcript_98980:1157-1414(-)
MGHRDLQRSCLAWFEPWFALMWYAQPSEDEEPVDLYLYRKANGFVGFSDVLIDHGLQKLRPACKLVDSTCKVDCWYWCGLGRASS